MIRLLAVIVSAGCHWTSFEEIGTFLGHYDGVYKIVILVVEQSASVTLKLSRVNFEIGGYRVNKVPEPVKDSMAVKTVIEIDHYSSSSNCRVPFSKAMRCGNYSKIRKKTQFAFGDILSCNCVLIINLSSQQGYGIITRLLGTSTINTQHRPLIF